MCSNRAATRVENIRTQQKTAPLSYPDFALYKQNLEEVGRHKKRLCCLYTAEVAGSIPASPTQEKTTFGRKNPATLERTGFLLILSTPVVQLVSQYSSFLGWSNTWRRLSPRYLLRRNASLRRRLCMSSTRYLLGSYPSLMRGATQLRDSTHLLHHA